MQPTNEVNPEMTPEEAAHVDIAEAALEENLRKAEAERDEYLDMAQRIKAEFENFRKRNNAVRSEAWEDGARDMIAQMLPVIDNLERALTSEHDGSAFCDGVELVYKQLMDILEKRGVTVINRVGEVFDPELEEAVMQVDASQGEAGTVATVLQRGYQMNGRVIRHAMVSVVAAG